jgi:hypothetical protein
MASNPRRFGTRIAAGAVAVMLLAVACQSSPVASTTIPLGELKSSGVTGTATLFDMGAGRARVDVQVDPNGNVDMPAHIHPGSCHDLVPQPRFPLENVRDGRSSTVVPVGVDELMAGELAVTLHQSNENLEFTTACGDLAR